MIDFQNVRKSFGPKPVLRGLTFKVHPGEVYTLLGPNGAGKTTAINILCNLLDADEGTVRVGRAGESENTDLAQLGVAPQEISLYLDLTVRENLEFFAEVYGIRGQRRNVRVGEVIESLRLGPKAEIPVANLSGGWKRRINLAVALISAPSTLILDEPTAGLDIESRHELWDLIKKLSNSGVAILLTTHLLDEAERLSHRIGILHEGRIVAEGSLEELRSQIAARQVATVDSDHSDAIRDVASKEGWPVSDYAGRLTLLMPQLIEFSELVRRFEGVPLKALSLEEISLEHIYVEKTRGFEKVVTR